MNLSAGFYQYSKIYNIFATMKSTFTLSPGEFSAEFVEFFTKFCQDKYLKISIETLEDETEYLLATEANRNHILEEKGNSYEKQFTPEEFKDLVKSLVSK